MTNQIVLTASSRLCTVFALLCAALAILCGVCAHAEPAQGDQSASTVIEMGLAKALGTTDDAGPAIRAYMAEGIINKRPNQRVDYTDYYVVNKPAQFLGHELQLIEQEYMTKYVGCCVSPGTGLTVRLNGSPENLRQFAMKNRCSFEGDVDFQEVMRGLNLTAQPGKYASISCRERDRETVAATAEPAAASTPSVSQQSSTLIKCESADPRWCSGNQGPPPSRYSSTSPSATTQNPTQLRQVPQRQQGGDRVAAYANGLANQLEQASHPACGAFASNIRMLGSSSASDFVRMRQVDAMFDKVPRICLQ